LKRLSAGKPEQLRLDGFVLYLDENLDNCKPIIEALEQQNIRYERHHAHYPRGTDDDVWLPFVGERGWIVLTKDKRNRYNEWEKLAVQTFSIREFYFGSGNFTGAEMAESLKLALPELKRAYHSHEPPLVVSITRSGAITVVFDKHGSTHERRKAAKVKTKPQDAL
jgi:hypothetical protein